LFYVFTASVCFAQDLKSNELFEIPLQVNDVLPAVHKNIDIKNNVDCFDKTNRTFFEEIIKSIPKDEDCVDISKPKYLLDDVTTKYFERGPLSDFHSGLVYRGAVNFNFLQQGPSSIDTDYFILENNFTGNFKDGKTSFTLGTRYVPQARYTFFQFLPADAFITHKFDKHTKILFGSSRTHTGEDGSLTNLLVPFINYSQIGRTFGNTRKFGVSLIGDYDLFEYDLGGFSSDTYYQKFFPGGEFTGWLTFKPLGKTDGRYGKLNLSGGVSSGKNDSSYTVAGGFASYEYKKFKMDFEMSDADGYNGAHGISTNHARGYYSSVYCRLNNKLQLLARYDAFQPNVDVSSKNITEYVCGINYFIKGQALRLILNYVYRQNDFGKDSHRIILGTQILL